MTQNDAAANADYESAVRSAVYFDLPDVGKIQLTGKEAVSFLNNLCTNDIAKLAVGSGCEAFLTTAQAKIVASVLVYKCANDSLWLDVGKDLAPQVVKHLDRYLISEQVAIADSTGSWAQFHVAGPNAPHLLSTLLGISVIGLGPLQHVTFQWRNTTCQARRHDPLGVPGFDLLVGPDTAPVLRDSLEAVGVCSARLSTFETLRIEAGTSLNGQDIDDSNLPQEVNRVEKTVSFTKGCYIGQETVARIRAYGHVNRSLCGVVLDGAVVPAHGDKLYHGAAEVGQATSATFSPRLGKSVALAYLRRGHEQPGTEVELANAGKRFPGFVSSLPFIPTTPG